MDTVGWVVLAFFVLCGVVSYIWNISREKLDEDIDKKVKQRLQVEKKVDEIFDKMTTKNDYPEKNLIEIQKEEKKSDENLFLFGPNWRPVYEELKNEGLKKLIQRIDNLSDTERIKIIDDFRKSLEGIIPDFGKDFLVELDTQLSHFRKSKEFLMYVTYVCPSSR